MRGSSASKRLPCILIFVAASVTAQVLSLPPRATNALAGDEFAKSISALDLTHRDAAVADAFLDGNAPDFLRHFCAITVTNVTDGRTNMATFFAAPDYLAIGADREYLLMPVSPNTAQRIADQLGCVLPTRKMVDAIYAAAVVKLPPAPIPPSPAMTTVAVFERHNEMVRAQREALLTAHPLGTLVAGHKKDLVISARLASVTNKVAIYGWHQTNGVPIQPLYLGHTASWVDYSQCARLISKTMLVNGETKSVAEVLADTKFCGLLSDEGVVTHACYPTNPPASLPVVREQINLPWPEKFVASPHFGEMTREIQLPDEVRILINTPSRESISPDMPLLLIFYSVPNGNTIEETIGKQLQPGDDWHFDIQHIGAQTRWLRNEITNHTIVVVYLEAGTRSWPVWRQQYGDRRIAGILDGIRGIFSADKPDVVLAGHSGGGSLIFGYLNAVDKIPADVKRIAFLDSDYAYDTKLHAGKIINWLGASEENHLSVLAYQDYLALLDGKTFVSESGGTWGRSHVLLDDLSAHFAFTSRTNAGLEVFSALGGRVELLLQENPERKILHTIQVERNGFIQALLSGTADAGHGYEYLGERAYTNWIQSGN